MAVKKALKKAVRKPVRRNPVKKAATKSRTKIGDVYACGVCGLAVTVDETCGCVDACDIVCCDVPMKKKRGK